VEEGCSQHSRSNPSEPGHIKEKHPSEDECFSLAGDESSNWHPLMADFILLGRALESLGFTYFRDKVSVISDYLQYV
jgi:hypothetical protein